MRNHLKEARERIGKTQAQVADLAGIGVSHYQGIEYGKIEPGVRTAIRIADVLEVDDVRQLFAPAEETA